MSVPNSLKKFLAKDSTILIAILFGSHANDSAKKTSDIDIAIAKKTKMTPEEKVALVTEISENFDKEVDLLDLNTACGTVLQQAITTGRILINRDQAMFVNIIGKMIRDEEDFQKKRRILNREIRAKVFRT